MAAESHEGRVPVRLWTPKLRLVRLVSVDQPRGTLPLTLHPATSMLIRPDRMLYEAGRLPVNWFDPRAKFVRAVMVDHWMGIVLEVKTRSK